MQEMWGVIACVLWGWCRQRHVPEDVGCSLFTSAFSSIWPRPDVERVLQTPIGLSVYRTKKETGRLILDSGIRGSGH